MVNEHILNIISVVNYHYPNISSEKFVFILNNNESGTIVVLGKSNVVFLGDYKWELEAISNIIKNSIEHLNEYGQLVICYTKVGIYTEIVIEDNGNVINQKDLKHIFKRFYKGDNSKSNSIGICLSLSKKIIEQDHGQISVKSTIDKGTKFTIRYMR